MSPRRVVLTVLGSGWVAFCLGEVLVAHTPVGFVMTGLLGLIWYVTGVLVMNSWHPWRGPE